MMRQSMLSMSPVGKMSPVSAGSVKDGDVISNSMLVQLKQVLPPEDFSRLVRLLNEEAKLSSVQERMRVRREIAMFLRKALRMRYMKHGGRYSGRKFDVAVKRGSLPRRFQPIGGSPAARGLIPVGPGEFIDVRTGKVIKIPLPLEPSPIEPRPKYPPGKSLPVKPQPRPMPLPIIPPWREFPPYEKHPPVHILPIRPPGKSPIKYSYPPKKILPIKAPIKALGGSRQPTTPYLKQPPVFKSERVSVKVPEKEKVPKPKSKLPEDSNKLPSYVSPSVGIEKRVVTINSRFSPQKTVLDYSFKPPTSISSLSLTTVGGSLPM